jgi:hypothetical protein
LNEGVAADGLEELLILDGGQHSLELQNLYRLGEEELVAALGAGRDRNISTVVRRNRQAIANGTI